MSLRRTITAFSLLLVFVALSSAQDRSTDRLGCSLVDAGRPPQFIVYEDSSESEIRLRLRNNSSCAILVETDDTYPTEIKKTPAGRVRIESVPVSKDGLRLTLHYLVQRKAEALRPAYGWGDSVFVYEIPAGQSITFPVPSSHFKRHYNIAVPFGYSWEGKNSVAIGIGGVAHRVYFLFRDLPSVPLR